MQNANEDLPAHRQPKQESPYFSFDFSDLKGGERATYQVVVNLWRKLGDLDELFLELVRRGRRCSTVCRAVHSHGVSVSEEGRRTRRWDLLDALVKSGRTPEEHWKDAQRRYEEELRREWAQEREALIEEVGDFTPGWHNLAYCTTTISYAWTAELSYRKDCPTNNSWKRFSRVPGPACDLDYIGMPGHGDDVLRSTDAEISPIIWWNDWYLKDEFWSCHAILIDIDDPAPTLEESLSSLEGNVGGVIWTSKNHQKVKTKKDGIVPACDRYHGLLAIDRQITSLTDYRSVMAAFYYVLVPTADDGMLRGTWKTRGGGENAQIFSLEGGTGCIDTQKLVRIAKEFSPEYHNYVITHVSRTGGVTVARGPISCGVSSGHLRRQLEERWHQKTGHLQNTYQRVFSTLIYGCMRCLSAETLKATVRQIPDITDWMVRKDISVEQLDDHIHNARERYFSDVRAETPTQSDLLNPLNPLTVVDAGDLPELTPEMRIIAGNYSKLYDLDLTGEMEQTLRLFLHAIERPERRSILSVLPGLAKSTALTVYTAAHANRHNRILIVKRTIADCKKQRQMLWDLGVKPENIGVFAGYQAKLCKHPGLQPGNFDPKACRCRCGLLREDLPWPQRCIVGQTICRQDELWSCPVMIMSHSRFCTLWQGGKVPDDVIVVIDEAISYYHAVTMKKKDLADLSVMHPSIAERSAWLLKSCRRNCIRDTFPEVPDEVRQTLRSFLQHREDELDDNPYNFVMDDGSPNPAEQDWQKYQKQRDVVTSYLAAFGRRHAYERHFVFDNDDEWVIATSHVYADLPNRIVILDGSARYSNTVWPGFEILEVEEHKQLTFGNIHIHGLPGNPTRRNVKKTFAAYQQLVLDHIAEHGDPQDVCVLVNKGDLGEFKELKAFVESMRERGIEVKPLERGTIIGSNEGRDAEQIYIVTSLFDSVAEYVLRAALREDCEFTQKEIWRVFYEQKVNKKGQLTGKYKTVFKPAMRRGFEEGRINEAFRRTYADELIQYLMRSRARKHDGQVVDVFCWIPDDWVSKELQAMLPGIRVDGIDDSVVGKLETLDKETMENIADSELKRIAGVASNNDGSIFRLRKLLTSVYLARGYETA